MRFAIENSVSPPPNAPVVYRTARSAWWGVAFSLVLIAAIFAFVCLPLLNMGELTADEIRKQRIENNMPMIWLAFAFGALWLIVLTAHIGSLLFARVVADQNGLRWRPFPFVRWRSARWNEVTDCVLPEPKTAGNANIVLGQERVSLDPKNPSWPTLRDFVAARVALPDGLEAWRVPTELDAEARRAQSVKSDDGAPIRTSSKVWPIVIFGCVVIALAGSMFQYAVNNDPNPKPSNQYFVWAIVAFFSALLIVYPLLAQWREFIVADDEGLRLSSLTRTRRIAWAQIEDMFLLPGAREGRSFLVYIVVAGQNVKLEPLGRERDAILNRIEARALNSRSATFQARLNLPVGAALPLPATLHARAGWRAWLGQTAFVAAGFIASLVGTAALVLDIGWENFGTSRGIFLWIAVGYALLLALWLRRAAREWRVLRAYGDACLTVDEAGLVWRRNDDEIGIAWAQVRTMVRDVRGMIGTASFRVEGADGAAIVWDSWWPRAYLVAALVLEKCAIEGEFSARTQRRFYGLKRDAEGLTLSKNTPVARMPVWLLGGMWSMFVLLPTFELDFGAWLSLLLPTSVLLGAALFYWWVLTRLRVRCDARGLQLRGLWRTRFIAWPEVEAFGTGEQQDWVRARDGQKIRLWFLPHGSATWAQRQLREEIARRAPGAKGDWNR